MKSKILVALVACLALGACNSGSDKADDNKTPAEGIQGTSDTAAPDAHAAQPQPLNPSAPTQPAAPAATPANPAAPVAPGTEHRSMNEGEQQNLAAETSTTTIQQNTQDAAKTQLDVSVQAQGTPNGVTTTTTTTATPAAADDMHSHPED